MTPTRHPSLCGEKLLLWARKDSAFGSLPAASEPLGKEDVALVSQQAGMVRERSNGVLPDIYDAFYKNRLEKYGISTPSELDRENEGYWLCVFMVGQYLQAVEGWLAIGLGELDKVCISSTADCPSDLLFDKELAPLSEADSKTVVRTRADIKGKI